MSLQRATIAALAVTMLAVVFILANAEPFGRIFWHLLTIHDLPAAWVMAGSLAIAYLFATRGPRDDRSAISILDALDRNRNAVAVILWGALCTGSLIVYRNHPLSMDEYASVFQARIFAAGEISASYPPDLLDYLIPREFQNHFLTVNRHTGTVFSTYWPGFSLLLTPFVWLGIPWACNPTLVAASFLLIGDIARRLIAAEHARAWALLLSIASPAFVANGITYYSMPAHLLCNLVFVWLLLDPTPRRLLLAGLAGGVALVLHNPFPHLVFALPWIFWLAFKGRTRLLNVMCLLAGYLPVIALLGAEWSLWQQGVLRVGSAGDLTQTALSAVEPGLLDRAGRLVRGFLRVVQSPDELVVYARIAGFFKLWLWASPLLIFLAWWGGRRAEASGLRLLGASALVTFFAYFAIRFDQGHGWGYRYFHSAWGALPILGAAGVLKLLGSPGEKRIWTRFVLSLALLGLIAGNGLRFFQMGEFVSDHLAQFPPRSDRTSRLIMKNDRGYYGNDLIQNDPWLRQGPMVLLVTDEQQENMLLKRLQSRLPKPVEPLVNRFGKNFVDSE